MPVIVGKWIKQKIRTIETLCKRLIVVVDGVRIPEFASIVSVVPSSLHPHREIIIIDAFLDDLGITSIRWTDISDICIVSCSTSPEIDS